MQEEQTKKGPDPLILISFALAMIFFWYIAIPALFIWLIWKKTKLTEKNKSIISIIILLFFIILKISSDHNHRAPTITITEPENNISVQSDSITIKGIVDPENSQLHIEGNQVSLKNGNFEYEARLTDESNAILLIADNSDKKIENLLTVNRILSDDERAIVNLENIKNNDIVKLPQFEIKGSTLLEIVTVKINDQDVEIKNNQFSYIIDLKEGKNDINIIATNTKSFIIKKETIVVNRELTEKEIAVIEEERKVRVEKERIAREEARKKEILFPVKELINKTPSEIEKITGQKLEIYGKKPSGKLMEAGFAFNGIDVYTVYTLIKNPKVKYNGTISFQIFFDNPLSENKAWRAVDFVSPDKSKGERNNAFGISDERVTWKNISEIAPFSQVSIWYIDNKVNALKFYLLSEEEETPLYLTPL